MREEMDRIYGLVRAGRMTLDEGVRLYREIEERDVAEAWAQLDLDPGQLSGQQSGALQSTRLDDLMDALIGRARAALRTACLRGEKPPRLGVDSAGVAALAAADRWTRLRALRDAEPAACLGLVAGLQPVLAEAGWCRAERFSPEALQGELDAWSGAAVVESVFQLDLEVRPGDTVRVSSRVGGGVRARPGESARVQTKAAAWGPSPEQAQAALAQLTVEAHRVGPQVWVVPHIADWGVAGVGGLLQADYEVTLPSEVGLVVAPADWLQAEGLAAGVQAGTGWDVHLSGISGPISVASALGPVSLSGCRGAIEAESWLGDVGGVGCEGQVHLRSAAGNIALRDGSGSVEAVSAAGEINVDGWAADDLDLRTRRGNITFRGLAMPGRGYRLRSEEGDIRIELDPRSDAGFEAYAPAGEVTTDFPFRNCWREHDDPGRLVGNIGWGSGSMEARAARGKVHVGAWVRGESASVGAEALEA